MKRKLSFKQWLVAIPFFLFFIGITLFLYDRNHEDARFDAFTQELLLNELKANPIHFHYSVEDANAYRIDEASLTLPSYLPGQAVYDAAGLSVLMKQLDKFDPDRLSDNNRYFYAMLSRYLRAAYNASSYPYFPEPLSPASGSPAQIPILLAEYRIETIDDIENYLSILEQIPGYFEGLMIYEQEKASAGLFMADETADKLVEQCMDLMNPSQLDAGTHFLEITFAERLTPLVENGILTKERQLAYQSENERLLSTVVAPAYNRLADEITILKGNGKGICGLAHYPGGQDYYAALACQQSGSYRTIPEMKALLYNDLKTNYNAFLKLMQNNLSLQKTFLQEPALLPEMTPEETISCLQEQIAQDYPAIPQNSEAVNCTIKYVNECLEPYTAPAFYMIPPIDNVSDNTIYINALDTTDDLSLFTTLAHEGYPGHLYQTVYSQRALIENNISPLRSTLYYGGFVEGWAMYVELEAYTYAAKLVSGEHPEAADYYLACRLDRQIQLCLYSLLDIAIHYDGASLEDVREIFNSLGSMEDEAICAIYEYIAEEPANYLKYYLGYLEILELKKQAASLWIAADQFEAACADSDFLLRFHTFLLQNGPADFGTLTERLLQEDTQRRLRKK